MLTAILLYVRSVVCFFVVVKRASTKKQIVRTQIILRQQEEDTRSILWDVIVKASASSITSASLPLASLVDVLASRFTRLKKGVIANISERKNSLCSDVSVEGIERARIARSQ